MIEKEKKVKVKIGRFSSRHQKIARTNSGNTITAKKFLKTLEEKGILKRGTESNKSE